MVGKAEKVLLVVLDGFGHRASDEFNAISRAKTPFIDSLFKNHSHTTLRASGEAVGLPKGYMGNSEVGHLHIGAGRLVEQDMTRIEHSIEDKSFFKNKVLSKVMKGTVHVMGLLSDAGVHSHIDHLFALLEMAKRRKVRQVYVHAFLDGRDTEEKAAAKYLRRLERKLASLDPSWRIATLEGRYYAMDRDTRWGRTKRAYDAIVGAKGRQILDWEKALDLAYRKGETDEFVIPTVLGDYPGVRTGDSVVLFNFRADRAVQMTKAFVGRGFKQFARRVGKVQFVAMTEYFSGIEAPVAFPPVALKNTLGEVVSKKGLAQFRLAETEKWAHVTFFFNGLSDKAFKGEERKLIASPRIATYDEQPEMSAYKIAREAHKRLGSGKYDFMLINFANADMVGHTGKFTKTVKAIKVLDECLHYVVPCALAQGYAVVITADHGNAEQMRYGDGRPFKAHTTNKVPLIVISGKKLKLKTGDLYQVAPTVLKLMGVSRPKEMESALF